MIDPEVSTLIKYFNEKNDVKVQEIIQEWDLYGKLERIYEYERGGLLDLVGWEASLGYDVAQFQYIVSFNRSHILVLSDIEDPPSLEINVSISYADFEEDDYLMLKFENLAEDLGRLLLPSFHPMIYRCARLFNESNIYDINSFFSLDNESFEKLCDTIADQELCLEVKRIYAQHHSGKAKLHSIKLINEMVELKREITKLTFPTTDYLSENVIPKDFHDEKDVVRITQSQTMVEEILSEFCELNLSKDISGSELIQREIELHRKMKLSLQEIKQLHETRQDQKPLLTSMIEYVDSTNDVDVVLRNLKESTPFNNFPTIQIDLKSNHFNFGIDEHSFPEVKLDSALAFKPNDYNGFYSNKRIHDSLNDLSIKEIQKSGSFDNNNKIEIDINSKYFNFVLEKDALQETDLNDNPDMNIINKVVDTSDYNGFYSNKRMHEALLKGVINSNSQENCLGVKLSCFQQIIQSLNKTSDVQRLTISEVCNQYILPLTNPYQCSYCDYLMATEPNIVSKATVYIIHAWKYKLVDVNAALSSYFAERNEQDVYIWFDLFSINYHSSRPFEWWSGTLKATISEIGHTVMILAPWDDPVPLTRGWCVWELYCSIKTGCSFDVALNENEVNRFVEDVENDSEQAINKMLAAINCAKCECHLESDRQYIHSAIGSSIGFSALNTKIFEVMRDWVITKYASHHQKNNTKFGENDSQTLKSMECLGILYNNQGKFNEALRLFEKCLLLRRKVFGNDHPSTWTAISNLAELFQCLDRREDALPLFVECLDKRRSVFGNDHPTTLSSLNNLAKVYMQEAKYDEALPLYEECLDQYRRVLGNDHPDTLRCLNNLASLFVTRGMYDTALQLYLECLEKNKMTLGTDHPNTVNAINNVAILYCRQGKYDEAWPLLEESLDKRKVMLGKDHPDTLQSLCNLAQLYKSQGKYDKALPLQIECLEKYSFLFGRHHPDTLMALHDLAVLFVSQGKYDEAQPLLVECVEVCKASMGNDHPRSFSVLNDLAELYMNQGKFTDALPLFEECLDIRRSILGEQHPDTLRSLNNLALIYTNQGMYDKALPLYVKCIENQKTILGNDHHHTIVSLNNLAQLYTVQGKYDEALPLYLQCLERSKYMLGEDHPDTLKCLNNLGQLYCSQDKFEQALPLILKCLEKQRIVLGSNHPDTLRSLNNLAQLYNNQGRYNDAFSLLVECLENEICILGENHPDTLKTLHNMGLLYNNQGKYDEALTLFEDCNTKAEQVLGRNHPETRNYIKWLSKIRQMLSSKNK